MQIPRVRQTLMKFRNSILISVKCFAQKYDGATIISGQYTGVQTLIRSNFHNAVYTHCCAHNLI